MSAVDDLRRALTEAYGEGLILNGMSAEDLVDAAVEEIRRDARMRTRADHKGVSNWLRSQPGIWGTVGEYLSRDSAENVVRLIQTAKGASGSAYAPAGSFGARAVPAGSVFLVEARYVRRPEPDAD